MTILPNIILGLIAFGNIILALFVLFRSQKTKAHIAFAVIACSLSVWAYTNAYFQTTTSQEIAYIVSLLSYAGAATGMNAILYFTFTFPTDQLTKFGWRRYYKWIVFTPGLFSLFISLVPGVLLESVSITGSPRQLEPTWLIIPYAVALFFSAILIFANLRKGYRFYSGVKKLQILFIGNGLSVAIIFGIIFNLALPLLNNYSYIWLGPAFTSVFIASSAYAMLKYRLFDIKIRTQQVINVVIPVILAATAATAFSIVFYRLTDWEPSIIGMSMLVFGLFSYEFLRRALERTSFNHFLFSRTHKYQEALQQLAAEATTIVNISDLSEKIVLTLNEDMRIDKVAIVVSPKPYQTEQYELIEHVGFDQDKSVAFINPSVELLNAFKSDTYSYVRDEVSHEMHLEDFSERKRKELKTVNEALQLADASVAVGLRVKDTLLGFIILGDKRRGSYTTDDVELLEDISNQLAVALMHSRMHEEKTVLTRMLREEVAQATSAWKEKSKENEELSNVKSQFIEVASHQLRTPISVIRNSLHMVLEDYMQEADVPQDLQQITPLLRNAFLASDNLNNSINSILAAEEFIDKTPHVHVDRVELTPFLERRVRRARALIEAKSGSTLQLKTNFDTELPKNVVTDEEKLAMILDQLLMNAVLYTVEGEVTISAQFKKDAVEFRIQDTGIGIPETEKGTIFERFVRLKNAQRVVPDGTGLGLYLAQEYSHLLRGKLSFTSEEGVGSTFSIEIPLEYNYV